MAEREKRRATTFVTSRGAIINIAAPSVYIAPGVGPDDVTSPTEMRVALREELREEVYGIQEPVRKLIAQFTDKETEKSSIAQLADGTLLCAVYTHEPPINLSVEPPITISGNVTFRIYITKSIDRGASWSMPQQILASEGSIADPCLVTCPLNTYVGRRWPLSNRLLLFYTHFITGDLCLSTSLDQGSTWSAPIIVTAGAGVNNLYSSCAAVMRNNNLICVYSKWQIGAARAGIFSKVSADGGLTWGAEVTIEALPGVANRYHDVPSVVQMLNGNVICMWHYQPNTAVDYHADAVYRISTDYGATWGAQNTASNYLHFTMLAQLLNQDLVALGRSECPLDGANPQWGHSLDMIVSRDNAFTWEGRETLIQDLGKGRRTFTCMGYGTTILLDNGKLVASYTEVSQLGGHYTIYLIDIFSERLIDKLNRILGLRAERKYAGGFETERVM